MFPSDPAEREALLTHNQCRTAFALGGATYNSYLDGSQSGQQLRDDIESILLGSDLALIAQDDARFCACATALNLAELAIIAEQTPWGTAPEWHHYSTLDDYVLAGIDHARGGVPLSPHQPEWECEKAVAAAYAWAGERSFDQPAKAAATA